MCDTPNMTLIQRHFADVWNGAEGVAAHDTLAPDFRLIDSSGRIVAHGPEGYLLATEAFRRAFPDAHFAIADIVDAGDRVAVRLTMRGTHSAPFRGIPPTAASVAIDGAIFYRVSAGRLAESWGLWDSMTLMQQLGAVPQRE